MVFGLVALSAIATLVLIYINFSGVSGFATGTVPACCTVQVEVLSPVGITQGVASTHSVTCVPGETFSNCCMRELSAEFQNPLRLLGVRAGSCQMPQTNYPMSVPFSI